MLIIIEKIFPLILDTLYIKQIDRILHMILLNRASLVAQTVTNLPAMGETWV